MKKSDLRTGMVVEFRNGNTAMILLDNCICDREDMYFGENDWGPVKDYNDDLLYIGCSEYDIMKIYKPSLRSGCTESRWCNATPIWERKELTERQLKIQELEKQSRELSKSIEELKAMEN